MSQENVEAVRTLMPADGTDLTEIFGRPGGVPPGGLVREDAKVRFVAESGEMGGTGVEGFYEKWEDWLEPWRSYRIYTEDVVDRGDRVVMLVELVGVTKHDAVEMRHEAAGVFHFEGGQITEIVFTLDRDGALAD